MMLMPDMHLSMVLNQLIHLLSSHTNYPRISEQYMESEVPLPNSDLSSPYYPHRTFLRSILIFIHLGLGIPSGLFRAACHDHLALHFLTEY
jgi:hypothetical protein